MNLPIKSKERTAILNSLRAGVVPRIGLYHLQVGRKDEIQAMLTDLTSIEEGGAAIRFVIGRYGAGKSFFLNLCRTVALAKRFVVLQADLSMERRLHGAGGQARNLHVELLRNLAIKTKPEGGALSTVVERWVSETEQRVRGTGGSNPDVFNEIRSQLKPLQDLVSGYDFATVIAKYLEGYQTHNDSMMENALRWLRAEYTTKTEARKDLGVRTIIEDANSYDHLKLLAAFVRMAGYAGLLVNLDEMGILSHRVNQAQTRASNYETILRIVNDCKGGTASNIGFVFAGVDEFLEDRRRGLYSNPALAGRLAENQFASRDFRDFSGPVIRLPNLTREELYVLFLKIRWIFAQGDESRFLLPDDGIKAFMNHCERTIGAAYFQTPRDSVKAFVGLLSVLDQNPGTDFQALLGKTKIEPTENPDKEFVPDEPKPASTSDSLSNFRLKPS